MSIGTGGNPGNPVHVKVQEVQESLKLKESGVTWASLGLSIIAAVLSGVTVLLTWAPWGEVSTIEPSSYAIIRRDTLGGPNWIAKSEHLVLPVEWKNRNGGSVIIRRLELSVSKVGGNGESHKFYLVKEYPVMSARAFTKDYDFRDSLTLDRHSVSTRVLSFRSADPRFRFASNTEYEVTLSFLLNSSTTRKEEPGWRFCTSDSSNAAMIHSGSVRWDWWLFRGTHNGSCPM
jgi:hypothetical protein